MLLLYVILVQFPARSEISADICMHGWIRLDMELTKPKHPIKFHVHPVHLTELKFSLFLIGVGSYWAHTDLNDIFARDLLRHIYIVKTFSETFLCTNAYVTPLMNTRQIYNITHTRYDNS